MSVLVYRYGLRAPVENAALVRAQLEAAHTYRNTLVEIERGRRAARRALDVSHVAVSSLATNAAAAKAREEEAVRIVKASKGASRSNAVPPALREALVAARIARRDAVKALREARKASREDEAARAEADRIETLAADLRRNARAHTDAYWGTYLRIEEADQMARKSPLYDGAEPNDPRFQRWNGEGALGVQIQQGAPVDSIVDGKGTLLRIEMVPDRSGVDREDRRFARLWMRVGSDGIKPIWAVWPMLMHRPLPSGAVVKRASVHLRRIGPRDEWCVQIPVQVQDACRPSRGGVVAVSFGWSMLPDGSLRVGRWRDDAGEHGDLVLDAKVVQAIRYPDSLRSIRDRALDDARGKLLAWLEEKPRTPEWFSAATATIGRWRAFGRFASLAKQWALQRFDGDVEAFEALERWRYSDHHLWEWESSQRSKSLRRRRDVYRCIAAKLSETYDKLLLAGDEHGKLADLSKAARTPGPEAPKGNDFARSNRYVAAPGDLRLVLRNAFRGTVLLKGAHLTRVVIVPTKLPDGELALSNDAPEPDEDVPSLLLRHYREGRVASKPTPEAATAATASEGRWARARRLSAEKTARLAAKTGDAALTG